MNPTTNRKQNQKVHTIRWMPVSLALLSGSLAGFLTWVAAPAYGILSSLAAFVLGFALAWILLYVLTSYVNHLSQQMEQTTSQLMSRLYQAEEELRSMITIRPVLGESVVSFNGWAIEGRTGEQLLGLLQEQRLKPESTGLVLECGAGASTVLLARYMKQSGWGRIISLDHEPAFADKTRHILRSSELDDVATVMDTPLREWSVNGGSRYWYDFDPAKQLDKKIDLLIVDGPPGRSAPLARYPAVPLLKNWLHPGSVILIHDAHRPDEKQIVQMWSEELNVKPELHPNGKGAWVLRLPASVSQG